MTTIAAYQGSTWAVVAYDSKVTEDSRVFTLPRESGKVFQRGPYILGAAGDMRAVNLLAHTFKPPSPAVQDLQPAALDRFMSTKFIPSLKACFEEANYSEKGEQDSTVLAIVNGKVYEIGSNYEWCHDVTGLYALGSGSAYALGAMHALKDSMRGGIVNARTIVKEAVLIASRLDSDSGEPVYVLSQRPD
jgi:ATP-dependent protease HslVU (ClpYQ) peptidase subunit